MMTGDEKGGRWALPTSPSLDGVPFLDLWNGWALAADRNQWTLNKAKKWRGTVKWQPKAFAGSELAVLVRVMREKGLRVPPDASVTVNRFFAATSTRFLEWRDDVEALQRGRVA